VVVNWLSTAFIFIMTCEGVIMGRVHVIHVRIQFLDGNSSQLDSKGTPTTCGMLHRALCPSFCPLYFTWVRRHHIP
jgi:hypothetical protein